MGDANFEDDLDESMEEEYLLDSDDETVEEHLAEEDNET